MALIYEKKGKIAYITLNRPEVMNALDPETFAELSEARTDVRDDPDVWCAIITGTGEKAFCAGADLRKMIPKVEEKWHFWQTQEEQILNRGLEIWKPVIAAVNGYCLGGGMTLLLATDLRVAAGHAKFGLSEVKRGTLPGNGGTQRAIRQLPYPIAMWMLLSGEMLSAQDAQQHGLVNNVVPLGELMAEAERMADVICQNGPLAMRAIKELAVRGQYMPFEFGVRLEQAIGQVLRDTDDAKEGPKAFAEKRKPNFTGR
jgi:E-phenylitaconyl-CoA hydratase